MDRLDFMVVGQPSDAKQRQPFFGIDTAFEWALVYLDPSDAHRVTVPNNCTTELITPQTNIDGLCWRPLSAGASTSLFSIGHDVRIQFVPTGSKHAWAFERVGKWSQAIGIYKPQARNSRRFENVSLIIRAYSSKTLIELKVAQSNRSTLPHLAITLVDNGSGQHRGTVIIDILNTLEQVINTLLIALCVPDHRKPGYRFTWKGQNPHSVGSSHHAQLKRVFINVMDYPRVALKNDPASIDGSTWPYLVIKAFGASIVTNPSMAVASHGSPLVRPLQGAPMPESQGPQDEPAQKASRRS